MEKILMPKLGQTTDEGYIEAWHVSEGDEVEMGQPLFIVETDKAQTDVESVADGVVRKIVVPAGETVPAGTVIAYVGEVDEEVPE